VTRWPGLLAVALLAACGEPGPAPLPLGSVECTHCHMTVADARFGAELVTRRHKVFVFDDAGCLAAFVAGGTIAPDDIHSLWVSDYLQPDSLLAVEQGVFIRSPSLRTPMDSRIVAARPGPAADSLAAALGGERLAWSEVMAISTEQREE
jgi:copper chaperone NosL